MQDEYYNQVTQIEKKQGVFQVTSQKGVYYVKNLVIAAGVWNVEVGKMLGIHIPLRPIRGQIIVTEPLAPLISHTFSGMRQMTNGEVLVGYSKEEVGFNRDTRRNAGNDCFCCKYCSRFGESKYCTMFFGNKGYARG